MKGPGEKTLQLARKAGILVFWIGVSCALVFALVSANRAEQKVSFRKMVINLKPAGIEFFDRKELARQLEDAHGGNFKGKAIRDIKTARIEKWLIHNPYTRKAKVYSDMEGTVYVSLEQREPLLRVIRQDGSSYYIDKTGVKMPVSGRFAPKVPVACGNIYEANIRNDSLYSFVGKELYKIATYVDKHVFWKAQIQQIFVTNESEFILIPLIGEHSIIFGSTRNMEDKFDRLLIFYKKGLNRVGWSKYRSLDVRFNNQVIGKK